GGSVAAGEGGVPHGTGDDQRRGMFPVQVEQIRRLLDRVGSLSEDDSVGAAVDLFACPGQRPQQIRRGQRCAGDRAERVRCQRRCVGELRDGCDQIIGVERLHHRRIVTVVCGHGDRAAQRGDRDPRLAHASPSRRWRGCSAIDITHHASYKVQDTARPKEELRTEEITSHLDWSDMTTTSGPRRWHEQRWLIDSVLRTDGLEWDQPRIAYTLRPMGVDANPDFHLARTRISKFADLVPVFTELGQRRQRLAEAAEAAGRLVTAREHYFHAALLYATAEWSIWE